MKTKEEIQQHLDETVNTLLGQHRGRIDLVAIELEDISQDLIPNMARVAVVKMSGGCQGCAGARATLKTIVTNHIKTFDPTIVTIVDVTDHTNKTNAFFKE